MEREELSAWLRLQLTPGVGDASARKLLAAFGLPTVIFSQTQAALSQVVSMRQAQALLQTPAALEDQLETSCQWLAAAPHERRILSLGDADYPSALLQIEDPPILLYGMGAAHVWEAGGLNRCSQRSVAMVGSRNPSAQGAENAHAFAATLVRLGYTIVSGLALGVDGAAHAGALAAASEAALQQPPTLAVVGTGLDRVYPKQHRDLAHRIAQQGILLSEYALGTPPLAANFPQRNRIISALSQGTLVVEATLHSGSLITARMALEQGKEVFAIPGSIHSTQSRGCHALIRQGAKLVESAQDIVEELPNQAPTPPPLSAPTHTAHDCEDPVLQALGFEPTSLDALQARTGLDTPSLQAQLMTLELQGQLARLPGGLFQRHARA